MSQVVQKHILDKYTLIKKMGSGAYGHVWKAQNNLTKQIVALKKIFDAFQHSTDAQRTYRQIRVLNQLKHNNIVSLLQVIGSKNGKDIYLVFDFMQADLHSAIHDKILQQIHIKYITYQMFKAIKYLHSAQLIHRDLKPSNILLKSDCHTKICDFGLVRSLESQKKSNIILTQEVATRWYRAPEVLLGSKTYSKCADMWSLGCIIGQMFLGKPLFTGNSTLDQLQKIVSLLGKPSKEDIDSLESPVAFEMIMNLPNCNHIKTKSLNDLLHNYSKQAKIIIISLLQFNPKKRLTIEEAIRHSFIQNFIKKQQQIISNKIIKPDVSDNTKLGVKDYKKLIEDFIRRKYGNNGTPFRYQEQKNLESKIGHIIHNDQNNMILKKSKKTLITRKRVDSAINKQNKKIKGVIKNDSFHSLFENEAHNNDKYFGTKQIEKEVKKNTSSNCIYNYDIMNHLQPKKKYDTQMEQILKKNKSQKGLISTLYKKFEATKYRNNEKGLITSPKGIEIMSKFKKDN